MYYQGVNQGKKTGESITNGDVVQRTYKYGQDTTPPYIYPKYCNYNYGATNYYSSTASSKKVIQFLAEDDGSGCASHYAIERPGAQIEHKNLVNGYGNFTADADKITVILSDELENISRSDFYFVNDPTPPSVSLVKPTFGSNPGNVNISAIVDDGNGSGVKDAKVRVNGGDTIECSGSANTYIFPINNFQFDKEYLCVITATDNAGNEAVESFSVFALNPSEEIKRTVAVGAPKNGAYPVTLALGADFFSRFANTINAMSECLVTVKRISGISLVSTSITNMPLTAFRNVALVPLAIPVENLDVGTFAHKEIRYEISIGNVEIQTPFVIPNQMPTVNFQFNGGLNAGSLLFLPREAEKYNFYATKEELEKIGGDQLGLKINTGEDPDDDDVLWSLDEATLSNNEFNIDSSKFHSEQTNLSHYEGRIKVWEKNGNWNSSASPLYDYTGNFYIDSGKPAVSKMGRKLDNSEALVNYTLDSDFDINVTAQDDETHLAICRFWLGNSANTFTPSDTRWMRIEEGETVPISEITAVEDQRYGLEYILDGTDPKSINRNFPWSIPGADGLYYIYSQVVDIAGNKAKPYMRIMRGLNLPAGSFYVDFDPNAQTVWNLPKDTLGGNPSAASVSIDLPFILAGNEPGAVSVIAEIKGPINTQYPNGRTLTGALTTVLNGASALAFTATEGYGEYNISLRASNSQGSEQMASISLRVNAPPVLAVPDSIETSSGKNLVFSQSGLMADKPTLFIQSDDGSDGPYQASWRVLNSGNDPLKVSEFSDEAFEYVFTKDEDQVELGYTLEYSLLDAHGLVVKGSIPVHVRNTQSGPLYADEIWTGSHLLNGIVVVPTGRRLTIDACAVSAVNAGYHAGAVGIIIEEGGALVCEDSALDSSTGAVSWFGIRVHGTANITDSAIRWARQGIAFAATATGSMQGGSIESCIVGIHALGSVPTATGTLIANCSGYAVKEDAGGRAVLNNCRLSGNAQLYYEYDEGRVLSIEEINQLAGNSGNE